MAKDYSKRFYNSKAWVRCRSTYIESRRLIDGGLCERCRDRIGSIVHHKTILTEQNIDQPEVTLNHVNLELLCKECHDKEEDHFNDSRPKRKPLMVGFDEAGRPIPREEAPPE